VRWRQPLTDLRGAVEKKVHIAVRRGFGFGKAVDATQRRHDLLRNDPWCLSQPARKLEGEWNRQIAEGTAGRHFDRNRGEDRVLSGNVVETPDGVAHVPSNGMLYG
jgi:hypothetical protein